MYCKHFFESVFLQCSLIFALFATACTPQPAISTRLISTPKLDRTVTISASETPLVSSPIATVTTPSDLLISLQTIVNAIETNKPAMLSSLIGDEGVAAGGFATQMNFKGSNNSEEIVEAFAVALSESEPSCEGFAPFIGALPDKAIVVYRGIGFDWNRFGLSQSTQGDSMTLQLFKLSNGWQLVYITPLDPEIDLPVLGPLQGCPAPS